MQLTLIGGPTITVTPADEAQRAAIITAAQRMSDAHEMNLAGSERQRLLSELLALLLVRTEGVAMETFAIACATHQSNIVRLVRAICGPEYPLPDGMTTAA